MPKAPNADQLPTENRGRVNKSTYGDFARVSQTTQIAGLYVERSADDDGDRDVDAKIYDVDLVRAYDLDNVGKVSISAVRQRHATGVRTEATLFLEREQARKVRDMLNKMDLDD